jgi:hypothetical protein
MQIAKEVYEVRPRKIKGGIAFNLFPEVWGYSALKARGKIAMELAAARAEHMALLAFATKKVYVNDIDPIEIEKFENLKKALPEPIQEKLTALPGDCFDIMEKRQGLDERIDFILCRNLIHFFSNAQQARFLLALQAMMKIGGRAILTVNHILFSWPLQMINDQEITAFRRIRVFYYDDVKKVKGRLFDTFMPHSGETRPPLHSAFLYKLEDDNQGWHYYPKIFNELNIFSSLKDQIQHAIKINWFPRILHIRRGSVRILTTHERCYTKENLTKLVERNGFAVEDTFFVNVSGHLCSEGPNTQLGIVVKRTIQRKERKESL